MEKSDYGSKLAAKAAVYAAMSEDIEKENEIKRMFGERNIKVAAVNYGGEYFQALLKTVERAVIAAKREGVIGDSHNEEGAVAGAAHEAISQIINKALGLNVGAKIGIARYNDHISVAVFLEIGLVHLNEIAIGLSHRVV